MAVKLIASILTFLAHVCVGVVVFAFMLIAMNGFSESDANWGILAYLILAGSAMLIMTAAAGVLAHRLAKRKINSALVVLISVVASAVAGGLLIAASGVAGVVVAEVVRKNF